MLLVLIMTSIYSCKPKNNFKDVELYFQFLRENRTKFNQIFDESRKLYALNSKPFLKIDSFKKDQNLCHLLEELKINNAYTLGDTNIKLVLDRISTDQKYGVTVVKWNKEVIYKDTQTYKYLFKNIDSSFVLIVENDW